MAFIGFAMEESTACFGISPYALYSLCENPTGLAFGTAGGLILTGAGLYLLISRLRRSVMKNNQLKDSEWEGTRTRKKVSTWTILILAIVVGSTFATTSVMRFLIWQIYITKVPLHVLIDGINNEYRVGDRIDFYVGMEGYGPDCGIPNVFIWKQDNPDTGARSNIIWQLKNNDNLNTAGNCSLFPVDVPKQVVHIGDPKETKPLVINETGTYTAYVGDRVGRVFQVVAK